MLLLQFINLCDIQIISIQQGGIYIEKQFYKSTKWKDWKAIIDDKTCIICKNNHGKIFALREIVFPRPPVHFFCRCRIAMMDALIAGTATDDGTNGADWHLKFKRMLPDYYIKEEDALSNGWIPYLGNLHEVAPGQMLTKPFENRKGKLPNISGRAWTEADINYTEGFRNDERIIFSNDGLIFVTYDHYETFIEIL